MMESVREESLTKFPLRNCHRLLLCKLATRCSITPLLGSRQLANTPLLGSCQLGNALRLVTLRRNVVLPEDIVSLIVSSVVCADLGLEDV